MQLDNIVGCKISFFHLPLVDVYGGGDVVVSHLQKEMISFRRCGWKNGRRRRASYGGRWSFRINEAHYYAHTEEKRAPRPEREGRGR